MSADRTMRTGSCLCGAVRYRITGPMRPVVGCHCRQCRKQTGHYQAATAVRSSALEMVEERGLRWYRASDVAKRGFCGECGSTLFWQPDDDDRIAITAGSIDGETGLATVAHIFVADKGDYYRLDDGLPQYEQGDSQVPTPG
ncbi:MAG: GFA family protein [Geminicoccaceae bacterium]